MNKSKETLKLIVTEVNRNDMPPALKGGNALVLLYDEPRISKDLDFDYIRGQKPKDVCIKTISTICENHGWTYRIAKNTDTVTRFMIRENEEDNDPLKVEISHRQIQLRNITTMNNILTYDIRTLFMQKLDAYSSRDKVRDLQDIAFIINNYSNSLSIENINKWNDADYIKPFDEQFDYLWQTQKEELTSKEWSDLATEVLSMKDSMQKQSDRLMTIINSSNYACENEHTADESLDY